jgi:uncharacterized membrane protein
MSVNQHYHHYDFGLGRIFRWFCVLYGMWIATVLLFEHPVIVSVVLFVVGMLYVAYRDLKRQNQRLSR